MVERSVKSLRYSTNNCALLLTCVISDFIKGEAGTLARLKQTPPDDIAVSAITVMELRYGLALNPQRAQKIEPAIASIL